MRPLPGIAAVILLALSSAAVHAQTAQPTPIPTNKKPNFAPFMYRVGTWSCANKQSNRPTSFPFTTTWSLDPSGYWLVGKTTTKGASWYPHSDTGTGMIGYDFDAKRWIEVYTDTQGNYDFSVSKGWVGNKIVWHSLAFVPTADASSTTDETLVKVSSTKTKVTSGFTAHGKAYTDVTLCTKTT